jgi:hypothetical protein
MASNGRAQVVMMMMTTMMKLNFISFLRRSLHEADLLKLGVLVDENPRIWKIHGAFMRLVDAQHECERELRSRIAYQRVRVFTNFRNT